MKKPASKTELVEQIAKASGLPRAQVSAMLTALAKVAGHELRSHGIVAVPGLVRLVVVNKPARPRRNGINPFTKERCTFKACKASKRVKARASKTLLG